MIQNPLEPPPLSPDLDWMLQSDQVSDQAVTETIARDHFSSIYSLVRAYLDDVELASAVVFDTISQAVANRHQYWGDVPVRAWLFSLAYRLCQKHRLQTFQHRLESLFWGSGSRPVALIGEPPDGDVHKTMLACQAMPRQEFVGLLLKVVHRMDNCSIGRIMNLSEVKVGLLLRRAYLRIGNPKPEILDRALAEYASEMSFDSQQVKEVVDNVQDGTRRQFRRLRTALSVRGLMFIAAVVVVVLAFTWYAAGVSGARPASPKRPIISTIVYVTATPDPNAVLKYTGPAPVTEEDQTEVAAIYSRPTPSGPDNVFYDPLQDGLPKKSTLDFDPTLSYYQGFTSDLTVYNSGPTCLGLVLRYLGWKGSILSIISNLMPNARDGNVMAQEMANYVQKNTDYRALIRFGGDIDLLQVLVAHGFPVIIQRGVSDGELSGWYGRYEIVAGYDHTSTIDRMNLLSFHSGELTMQSVPSYQMEADWLAFNHIYLVVFKPEQEKSLADILGSDFVASLNYRKVYENSFQEEQLYYNNPQQRFFTLFNRGSIMTYMEDYKGAAWTYDQTMTLYDTLPEKDKPWRIFWYQTRPYWAYYYTGQYAQVVRLASNNLNDASPVVLEESYYWRAMAEEALGNIDQAYQDMKTVMTLNPNFSVGIYQLERMKSGG